MNILVVDDEMSYRTLMKDLLTREGYIVLLAGDGEEALEKLESAPVDLVISDIYMPVMDGFKLKTAIRNTPKWEKLPILFVSAYDDQHSLDVIQDPKKEAFLKKGQNIGELQAWIVYFKAVKEGKTSRMPGSRFTNLDYRGE
jgi:CheY-like chemotaxis protein